MRISMLIAQLGEAQDIVHRPRVLGYASLHLGVFP
jgi:hypothetical protein